MTDQPRTPAGSPTGGQFATSARAETGVELDAFGHPTGLTATDLGTIEDAQLRDAAEQVVTTLRDAGITGTISPSPHQRPDSVELTLTDDVSDQYEITVAETSCRVRSAEYAVSTGDIDFIGRRNPFDPRSLERHLTDVRRGVATGRTWDALTSQRTDDVEFIGMQAWPDQGCARVQVTAVIDGDEYVLTTAGYEPIDVDSVDVLYDGDRLPKLLRHAVLHRTGESLAAQRGDGLERAVSTMAAWSRAVTHDPAWRP